MPLQRGGLRVRSRCTFCRTLAQGHLKCLISRERLLLITACSTWRRLSFPKTVEPRLFHLGLGFDGYYPGPGTSFDRLKSLLSKRWPDREMTADPLDLYRESS
jgi:hypothetical protein